MQKTAALRVDSNPSTESSNPTRRTIKPNLTKFKVPTVFCFFFFLFSRWSVWWIIQLRRFAWLSTHTVARLDRIQLTRMAGRKAISKLIERRWRWRLAMPWKSADHKSLSLSSCSMVHSGKKQTFFFLACLGAVSGFFARSTCQIAKCEQQASGGRGEKRKKEKKEEKKGKKRKKKRKKKSRKWKRTVKTNDGPLTRPKTNAITTNECKGKYFKKQAKKERKGNGKW